jgi:hypothetical protein
MQGAREMLIFFIIAYFSAGEKRKKLKIKKFTKRNGRKTVKNREFSVRGCYFCRKYDIIFRIIPMQRRGTTMDVRVGDVLEMKKNHPCGSREFLVLRSGMDFRLRCGGCGREMMVPRVKIEKNIRKIRRPEEETDHA